MKHLSIFTDPHLGTSRAAHTTAASAKALQTALYDQAMAICDHAENPLLCNGDLFDKANNAEVILLQGYDVASRCWRTLAGNHDQTNRADTVTSLDALKEMGVAICSAPTLSEPYFESFDSIYMVPHHASNELFVKACELAAAHTAESRDGLASYLFVHANYDFPMVLQDNTLNLTSEFASELLGSFDFIFVGHEHNPKADLDGRVVIMGNTHPTSFSDISDKFIYNLDLDTAELSKQLVWSKADKYRELKLGQPIPKLEGVQFVDIIGSESVETAGVVNQYLQEVWSTGESLLAVRNNVKILDALDGLNTEVDAKGLQSLEEQISADLNGTDLADVFDEILAEVRQ